MADVQTELTAMRRIANTLDALDDGARQRTMRWLHDRYDQTPGEPAADTTEQPDLYATR